MATALLDAGLAGGKIKFVMDDYYVLGLQLEKAHRFANRLA